MCLSLFSPSGSALAETTPQPNQATKRPASRPAYQAGQLHGDERILHALNRFTFGVRPGDLEIVRAMGIENWFDQQLHPETLDQSDLDARLAEFPAMQANPEGLLYYLPSNAVIRQAIDGKAPIPDRPALRAIYENEMARVEFRRQEKDQQKQQQASAVVATNPAMAQVTSGSGMEPGTASSSAANRPPQPEQASDQIQPPSAQQTGQMGMSPAADKPALPAFDPALIAEILALPAQSRIARLAIMKQPEYDAFRKALKPPQRTALLAGLTPAQKEFVSALENPQRLVADELASQRLVRDIYSNAQLQEVMTDFWLNHFNVYLHKNEATPYYLVSYERDVIRPNALGKFEDLLEATAHSPAMLLYLDNATSMGPDSLSAEKAKERAARNPNAKKAAPEGLNENYARELMELHTLGVDGGYTQADVTQVARVLTGWTVDRPQRGGAFKFDENRHEPGAKKVLGKKIKENGEKEGIELLHMLATRPATAQFISRKLAIRFVGDDPPKSLVDHMAQSYLASDGDISTVLKTLFHSPEFWASSAYRAKVKTPIEYVVSAARASNANTDNLQPLINALRDMGMPLYGAVPPTGYKWDSSNWVSTGALVNRMNFALSLAANKFQGVAVNIAPPPAFGTVQLADNNGSPAVVHNIPTGIDPANIPAPEVEEHRLELILVAGGVSDTTRSAVLQQLAAQVSPPTATGIPAPAPPKPMNSKQAASALEKQDQLLAGLLLGSPEFQRR
ncbi:MAG: DUF1800 domain-containing protein [Terracidiphilus sp.]|jgi:uncharacterized protein (DUF1800 family)